MAKASKYTAKEIANALEVLSDYEPKLADVLESTIDALQKRVEELEAKLDYPHEEIADMKSRIARLEGALDEIADLIVEDLADHIFDYEAESKECGGVYAPCETCNRINRIANRTIALAGKGGEDENR
jgi:uncharacterized protein Yka (UPF0111/DUF47 family)